MLALASCTEEDAAVQLQEVITRTSSVAISEPDYAPQTRLSVAMKRYLLEMYEGNLSATPEKYESTGGTFSVAMKKGVDYICLFWADDGAEDYDATNLQAVKQATATKPGKEAYYTCVTLNSNNLPSKWIVLRRAVTELSFINTKELTGADNGTAKTGSTAGSGYWNTDDLKAVTITQGKESTAGRTLNVGTGSVTDVAGAITRTFTNIGQVAANTTLATDYILAPKDEDKVLNLTIQLNTESSKSIPNAPFRQCFSTHIKGEYSSIGQFTFSVIADGDWVGTNEVTETAKVGDYYKDGTWSTENKATGGNPIIGVIYKVNADGTDKVVSLTEGTDLKWGPTSVTTGATSTTGKENTNKVFALIANNPLYNLSDWSIFNACKEQRTSTQNNGWCVPAYGEYVALFNVKSTINAKIKAISGTEVIAPTGESDGYWTSKENSTMGAFIMRSATGSNNTNKGDSKRVRFVLDF